MSNYDTSGKTGQALDIFVFTNIYTLYCCSISPAVKTALTSSDPSAHQSFLPSICSQQDIDETLPHPNFAEAVFP